MQIFLSPISREMRDVRARAASGNVISKRARSSPDRRKSLRATHRSIFRGTVGRSRLGSPFRMLTAINVILMSSDNYSTSLRRRAKEQCTTTVTYSTRMLFIQFMPLKYRGLSFPEFINSECYFPRVDFLFRFFTERMFRG